MYKILIRKNASVITLEYKEKPKLKIIFKLVNQIIKLLRIKENEPL